jgi:hypothetical protein
LSTTCGATLATTKWSKSTRRGGGEASREASPLSFVNFIVPLPRCRNAHVAIDVPSASKWQPPSEQRKLARCEHARADVVLNAFKNAEHAGAQEAQKQDSGTSIKQWTCHGCQRIFGSAQGLASHLKDSYRCPSSSNYQQPTGFVPTNDPQMQSRERCLRCWGPEIPVGTKWARKLRSSSLQMPLVMLADAGGSAVFAPVPLAVMLADAGAPAVIPVAPAAFMLALADAGGFV